MTLNKNDKLLISVYGSLMMGQPDYYSFLGVDPHTKYVGEYHSKPEYELYDLNGEAILVKGGSSVLFQVFEITHNTLDDIDTFLGNISNIPSDFSLVETPYGEAMLLMHAHPPVSDAYIIDNGDWRDHVTRLKLLT